LGGASPTPPPSSAAADDGNPPRPTTAAIDAIAIVTAPDFYSAGNSRSSGKTATTTGSSAIAERK